MVFVFVILLAEINISIVIGRYHSSACDVLDFMMSFS